MAKKVNENSLKNLNENKGRLGKIATDEQSKIAKKGGIARAKQVKAEMTTRELFRWVDKSPAIDSDAEIVAKAFNIPKEQVTNEMVRMFGLYKSSRKGDVKAYETWQKYSGNQAISESEERNLAIKERDMCIKEDEHRIEMERFENAKNVNNDYKGIPITGIAPCYSQMQFDIEYKRYSEYVLHGGRGSSKSSCIGLDIIDLMEKNPEYNGLVLRKVTNTIKDSVYNQIVWAIDYLGLNNQYKCVSKPSEITKISTGQKIFFRGADDPMKIKSIKPTHGYIAILWFEELDQFNGEDEIRNIRQSAIRGGDDAYVFMSFNPPKSALNWANKYVKIPKENRLVVKTDYTMVPKEWLGQAFIDEALFVKETNPNAYEHEYLGVANGIGGNVFDNVECREITDKEISQFDRVLHGVDWGWFPDPFAFTTCHYDASRMTLYIYEEYRCNKKGNRETADVLIEDFKIGDDLVLCDSAEHKSTADYRAYGINARDCEKGAGSVDYSMKWLASLVKIVIDPKRCPKTAEEFINYEYERDKEGNIISGYPDKDNHSIDAVRYATNDIWKRRGQ